MEWGWPLAGHAAGPQCHQGHVMAIIGMSEGAAPPSCAAQQRRRVVWLVGVSTGAVLRRSCRSCTERRARPTPSRQWRASWSALLLQEVCACLITDWHTSAQGTRPLLALCLPSHSATAVPGAAASDCALSAWQVIDGTACRGLGRDSCARNSFVQARLGPSAALPQPPPPARPRDCHGCVTPYGAVSVPTSNPCLFRDVVMYS